MNEIKMVNGVRVDDGSIFESQSYRTDEEKEVIASAIQHDADDSGIAIKIEVSTQ